jgi:tRNA (Thr-GGU) A37 N-methylase
MESIILNPIGIVRSTRTKIADDNWDVETVYIELDPSQFSPEAFAGLSEFSHVQILFFMNQVKADQIETASRHPRNNPKWPKVGIFAHRAKNRPNRMGITICEVLKLDGLKLYVEGLDAIDGTPWTSIRGSPSLARADPYINPHG